MPLHNTAKAPSFSGEPCNLLHFLEDIKQLCEDAGYYADQDKIRWTLHYLSRTDEELWVTLDAVSKGDWEGFIEELKTYYPRAEYDDRQHTVSELDEIIQRYASWLMNTRGKLGEYFREFQHVATFLRKRNHLSERERDTKFLQGFHVDFRNILLQQLSLLHPQHYMDEPWAFKEVYEEATFLL
ncbi:hypothetical protein M404DRAFT_104076, partial [Pisolithus tinctorius Marx 270]